VKGVLSISNYFWLVKKVFQNDQTQKKLPNSTLKMLMYSENKILTYINCYRRIREGRA
jgi:hypothetical protein